MTEAPTLTLIDFLLARITEDEEVARAVVDSHAMWDWESYIAGAGMYEEPASGFASHYRPARVLAECAAKRRIVELHARAVWHQPAGAFVQSLGRRLVEEGDHLGGCSICAGDRSDAEWPCDTLRALAGVYADHADYRPEWRP